MSDGKSAARTPPSKMTKRQLSRHQREVRLQRFAVASVGLALLVALFVPLYGYWREVLTKGDHPIAVVRGQTITTDLYARYLGYQQALLEREIRLVSEKITQGGANSTERESAQLQLSILQQRAQMLPSEVVDRLIEHKLVRDEANERGIVVTPAELDDALQREMSDYPLGGFRLSFVTDTSPDLLTLEQAREELRKLLARGRLLTEEEVRILVLEDTVLRAKVRDAVGESVKTSGEQVRARRIQVETEEQAKDVISRLQKGEEFAALARELSRDTLSKDEGGELGWVPRGERGKEFDDAAFGAKVGEIVGPIKTGFGYDVIVVDEKAEDRPYEESYVQNQRRKAFNDWLTGVKMADPAGIQDLMTSDKVEWAVDYVARELKATQGQ